MHALLVHEDDVLRGPKREPERRQEKLDRCLCSIWAYAVVVVSVAAPARSGVSSPALLALPWLLSSPRSGPVFFFHVRFVAFHSPSSPLSRGGMEIKIKIERGERFSDGRGNPQTPRVSHLYLP